MAGKSQKHTGKLILAGVIGAVTIGVWSLYQDGLTKEGFLLASRLTARFSFAWFLLAFAASSVARLWPSGWRTQMLRNRRGLGLAFASAHLVHASFFLTAIFAYGHHVAEATLYGGTAGYVFVAAMVLTSFDGAVRALGPTNWKLLHASGMYVLGSIFAFTYYGGLDRHPLLSVPALFALGLALLLRIAAWFAARKPAPARA